MADEFAPLPVDQTGPLETQSQTANTGFTSGSSQEVAAPVVTQALNDANTASQQQAGTQQKIGDAQAIQTAGQADQQDAAADLARQQAADAAANHQNYLDRVDAARSAQQQAEDDLQGTKFHDYFHGGASTGNKILTAVGDLFTGLSGNTAAQQAQNEMIQNRVKNDFDKQRAEYTQKYETARMKGEDVNNLYSQWERENALTATKEAKAHEAVAAQMLAAGTRAGIPVAQLQNSALVQGMNATAAEKRAAAFQHFDKHLQSSKTVATADETKVADQKSVKINDKQRDADAKQADMTTDLKYLEQHPATPKAADAARRVMAESPGLWDRTKGFFTGDLPDYASRLNPEEREQMQAILRVTPNIAEAKIGPRAATNKDALTATQLAHIPMTTDRNDSKIQANREFLRSNAAKTPRPAYWQGEASKGPDVPPEAQAALDYLKSPDAAKNPTQAAAVRARLKSMGIQ